MYCPDFNSFMEMTKQGNLIPVYREILADTETPVSALMKMNSRKHIFLLESVEGGEKWGRYTFMGADPRTIFRVRGDEVLIEEGQSLHCRPHGGDPIGMFRELMSQYKPVEVSGLPRFYGGAVGFLGYDMVRFIERLPDREKESLAADDGVLMITDTLIIFDNVRHTIKVVACVVTGGHEDFRRLYDEAVTKIEDIVAMLTVPLMKAKPASDESQAIDLESTMQADRFKAIVEKAKEYIVAGDIIQVVLSQRFQGHTKRDAVDLYRALRYINPSPYLFFLKIDDFYMIGSSPEVLVRMEEGVVELRPIAGTKKRGKNEQQDRELADELLNDPKERAEHVMLVDLGRNDLGRIARVGSVQVNQLMVVERYSHVMHLVSNIQAHLSADCDAFDIIRATFPAGTLTGAPKIRAMEIIEELEPTRRGPYGGAVGYFSFSGNMDFCITIRTLMLRNGQVSVQAGAGIVADSNPEEEYKECLNKAKGMMLAIRLAEADLNISYEEKKQ